MSDDTLDPQNFLDRELKKDKKRLDWLQEQNNKARYTGKCEFRWSSTGRGWRLHETSRNQGVDSVREAIDRFMFMGSGERKDA